MGREVRRHKASRASISRRLELAGEERNEEALGSNHVKSEDLEERKGVDDTQIIGMFSLRLSRCVQGWYALIWRFQLFVFFSCLNLLLGLLVLMIPPRTTSAISGIVLFFLSLSKPIKCIFFFQNNNLYCFDFVLPLLTINFFGGSSLCTLRGCIVCQPRDYEFPLYHC